VRYKREPADATRAIFHDDNFAPYRLGRPSLRQTAHRIVLVALKKGTLVRPDHCPSCGLVCVPHAHHDDYLAPLAVRWLCAKCHQGHHAMLARKARAS
jgi:ribosomal protein S27AE